MIIIIITFGLTWLAINLFQRSLCTPEKVIFSPSSSKLVTTSLFCMSLSCELRRKFWFSSDRICKIKYLLQTNLYSLINVNTVTKHSMSVQTITLQSYSTCKQILINLHRSLIHYSFWFFRWRPLFLLCNVV